MLMTPMQPSPVGVEVVCMVTSAWKSFAVTRDRTIRMMIMSPVVRPVANRPVLLPLTSGALERLHSLACVSHQTITCMLPGVSSACVAVSTVTAQSSPWEW